MPKEKEKPTGEGGTRKDACPWCAYEGDELDPLTEKWVDGKRTSQTAKKKRESEVLEISGLGHQCLTCGKVWLATQLGKPWSLALERGEAWERENKAKQLTGR